MKVVPFVRMASILSACFAGLLCLFQPRPIQVGDTVLFHGQRLKITAITGDVVTTDGTLLTPVFEGDDIRVER